MPPGEIGVTTMVTEAEVEPAEFLPVMVKTVDAMLAKGKKITG